MPHLNDEVADFIWVGWPRTVHGCGDEGWCHIVAENHLRPGLQTPVELGDVIVLQESEGGHEMDTTERLHFHFSLLCIGEGNGNPLQCSCLENLRDGGAWWAAIYGVAQGWT